MRLAAALLAALLASGCTMTPGCFAGMGLLPPTPVVVCGFDVEMEEKDDLDV